jgi:gliding motility-associated-like protein
MTSNSITYLLLFFILFANLAPLHAQETCTGNLGENIFEEGDFGSGTAGIVPFDPGIAPGYTYDPTPPPGDGFYTITSSFGAWNFFFDGWFFVGSDNSSDPNGYMMVVNADFSPGIFYEQTVDGLCANTLYYFSADILNVVAQSTPGHINPNVSFLLNGTFQYSTGDVPQDQQWRTYGFTFTTGPNTTSLTLTLRNNAPGGIGNDLAIDNIEFRACGPEALILPETIENICEDGQPIPLNATILGDQFENPAIQWQRSPDGQNNWEDIPGATGESIMHIQLSGGFYYYRYLLANSPDNLANPKCYIISNVKVVFVQPKFYEITDTICAGSSFEFGGEGFTETGTYVDSLTSSIGCDSIVTLRLTQIPDPGLVAEFTASDTQCADSEDGEISITGIQNAAFPISLSLNGMPAALPAEFDGLGVGEYTLEVTDRHQCQLTQTIEIGSPPPLVLDAGEDQSIFLGEQIELRPFTNQPISIFQWSPVLDWECLDPDCFAISLVPQESTTLYLEAGYGADCLALDSVRIEVQEARRVYIPSAFSPNDDGRNDTFTPYVQSPNVEQILSFQIYDRWGGLVFEKSNYLPGGQSDGWDGSKAGTGNLLKAGVYAYVVEVLFLDGLVKRYHGSVQLVR